MPLPARRERFFKKHFPSFYMQVLQAEAYIFLSPGNKKGRPLLGRPL